MQPKLERLTVTGFTRVIPTIKVSIKLSFFKPWRTSQKMGVFIIANGITKEDITVNES